MGRCSFGRGRSRQTSDAFPRNPTVLTHCLRRWPTQPLGRGTPAFLLEPALPRCRGGRGRSAPALDAQRLAERLDQALDRELTVSPLAPLVLRDRAQHRPRPLRSRAASARVSARTSSRRRRSPRRASPTAARAGRPGRSSARSAARSRRRGRITERVTRIDSPGMAAILLDVDGVLHVSGRADPRGGGGGQRAAARRVTGCGSSRTTPRRPRGALADGAPALRDRARRRGAPDDRGRRRPRARRPARARPDDGGARRGPRRDRARRRRRRGRAARRRGRDRGDRAASSAT